MWPPCPCACQGWQVARHSRGDAGRAGVGRSRMAEGAPALPLWEKGGIGTLAPTQGAPSIFGQVAAGLVCVPLESAMQRPSAEWALEEEQQRFMEAARGQPLCCAPSRGSHQRQSLVYKPRIMFHLLLGAAVGCDFVSTHVAHSSRATASRKAPGHARNAGNALPIGGTGCR